MESIICTNIVVIVDVLWLNLIGVLHVIKYTAYIIKPWSLFSVFPHQPHMKMYEHIHD